MRERGLTLVELLVALAIAAILLRLGIPSVRKWYCNYKLKSFSSELFSYMQLARLFAMTYGSNTYLLFIPEEHFVAFYVDDVSENGKIDSGESNHITFPLPSSMEASKLPAGRKGSIGDSEKVKGIAIPDTCGISLTTTFSASQAMFKRDGTGKAGTITIQNDLGKSCRITVSIVGRVSLSKE